MASVSSKGCGSVRATRRSNNGSSNICESPRTIAKRGSSATRTAKVEFLRQVFAQTLEQRAAAGENYAAIVDVTGNFGRQISQRGTHFFGDLANDRLSDLIDLGRW